MCGSYFRIPLLTPLNFHFHTSSLRAIVVGFKVQGGTHCATLGMCSSCDYLISCNSVYSANSTQHGWGRRRGGALSNGPKYGLCKPLSSIPGSYPRIESCVTLVTISHYLWLSPAFTQSKSHVYDTQRVVVSHLPSVGSSHILQNNSTDVFIVNCLVLTCSGFLP